jgi:hypothetical protein
MMRYAEARPKIKTGDLLAWSHGGWSSWHDIEVNLVRMATRSEYSHVGLALAGGGRVFILEAVGGGVRLFPLSRELPFYWVRRPVALTGRAVDFAFARIGEPYSKWQAIKAYFGLLTTGDDARWQCAEYVLSVLRADGEDLAPRATPSAVVQAAALNWGPIVYVDGKKKHA